MLFKMIIFNITIRSSQNAKMHRRTIRQIPRKSMKHSNLAIVTTLKPLCFMKLIYIICTSDIKEKRKWEKWNENRDKDSQGHKRDEERESQKKKSVKQSNQTEILRSFLSFFGWNTLLRLFLSIFPSPLCLFFFFAFGERIESQIMKIIGRLPKRKIRKVEK